VNELSLTTKNPRPGIGCNQLDAFPDRKVLFELDVFIKNSIASSTLMPGIITEKSESDTRCKAKPDPFEGRINGLISG